MEGDKTEVSEVVLMDFCCENENKGERYWYDNLSNFVVFLSFHT